MKRAREPKQRTYANTAKARPEAAKEGDNMETAATQKARLETDKLETQLETIVILVGRPDKCKCSRKKLWSWNKCTLAPPVLSILGTSIKIQDD